ncbi:hypothetical protein SeMB42_g05043 [Synchytrium endobioticum]|uniref:Proline-rich protein PRCC n=1 Tax=Synchytrium endobioticum TaxID=286115 RepID=A0A507CU02_9FUNG|nr:hypothetical protein SeMB42_g05043 [Synchytrium endobioticum]TPX48447.1 hypothetical protein SeLEV6574_g02039 [Synchytrium endobioticum]
MSLNRLSIDHGNAPHGDHANQSPTATSSSPSFGKPKLHLPEPSSTDGIHSNAPASGCSSSTQAAPLARKKVRILVPDIPSTSASDDDDDNDGPVSKRIKANAAPSSGAIGLLSFLPAPKNPASIARTDSATAQTDKPAVAFQPRGISSASASKKKEGVVKSENLPLSPSDVGAPNQDETATQSTMPTVAPAPFNYEIDTNAQLEVYEPVANQYRVDQYQYDVSSYYATAGGSSVYPQLSYEDQLSRPVDPDAVRMLSGRNSQNDGPIQIKEVFREEQIGDRWQYEALKNASKEKQESINNYMHLAGNAIQKRKHNIMSLAFEAKQRQAELQEQAANRRAAKKAAGAKYGF